MVVTVQETRHGTGSMVVTVQKTSPVENVQKIKFVYNKTSSKIVLLRHSKICKQTSIFP